MTATAGLLAQTCGWGMHDWGGGWIWLWGTAIMAIWIAVIGGVVWLVLRSVRAGNDTARRILDQRLARGEITIEEHRELTRALHSRE